MGYTTKYSGTITVEPKMDWTMRAAVREFCANADVGKVGKNLNLDGTCDWKASDDFTGLIHNGMEKSYDQDKWLQALIDDLLAPAGFNCNGIIDCQGEDVGHTWRIYVRDNEVSKDTPSYADKVNAPLTEDVAREIGRQIASGDYPRYKRASEKQDVMADDPKLAELRAKLHPEPEPAQPLSSVGDALRDLGNAIAFKANQGVEAVADFVTDVEGALELCAQEGNTKPLDALFKTLRAEHDAEATQAEQAAAVDDDIPAADAVTAYIDSMTDEELEPAPETFESLLDASSLGSEQARAIRAQAPKLNAEQVAAKYRLTVEEAQQMIDADAVEAGGILFVNEAARDKFIDSLHDCPGISQEEHDTAWQKIIKDQADEEQVRERLQASYARHSLDAERDAEASAAGTPDQWDDTALNEYWLIWSNKHSLWWMPNQYGYTEHLDKAGRYTFDQAVAIVKKSSLGWGLTQSNTPPTTMVPDPSRY